MNNDGWQDTLAISQQQASQLTGSSLVSPFRRCVPVQFNAEVDMNNDGWQETLAISQQQASHLTRSA